MIGPFNIFGRQPSPIANPSIDGNSTDKTGEAKIESDNSLKNRFPAMRVLTSCIRSLTAGLSSAGSAIKDFAWSVCSAVANATRIDFMTAATAANDVTKYSTAFIEGTNASDHDQPVSIPASGSFTAGANLRRQLTKSLFETVVSEANSSGKTEPNGINQFAQDLYRCTSMHIEDEMGNGSVIGGQLNVPASTIARTTPTGETVSVGDEMLANAMAKLTPFVGGNQGYPLAQAIFSTANQTMGNTCGYLLKSHMDPNLSTDAAIGFASPSERMGYNLRYDLERVTQDAAQYPTTEPGIDESASVYSKPPDHFILTMTLDGRTNRFMLNQPDSPADAISLKDKIAYQDVFSVKITPNKSFDSNKAQTKENFPYSLEVLKFSSTYTTPQAKEDVDTASMTSDRSSGSTISNTPLMKAESKKLPDHIQHQFSTTLNDPEVRASSETANKIHEWNSEKGKNALAQDEKLPAISEQFYLDLDRLDYFLQSEDGPVMPLYDRSKNEKSNALSQIEGDALCETERETAAKKFVTFVGDDAKALAISKAVNQQFIFDPLEIAMHTANGPLQLPGHGGGSPRGNRGPGRTSYTFSKSAAGDVIIHFKAQRNPTSFVPASHRFDRRA